MQLEAFRFAIKNEYWFEFFLDDLPVWGWVGDNKGSQPLLFTHSQFTISFNQDRVFDTITLLIIQDYKC